MLNSQKISMFDKNVCPGCGNSAQLPYKKIRNLIILKCKNCRLLHTQLNQEHNLLNKNKIHYSVKYFNNYLPRWNELKDRYAKRCKEIESCLRRGGKLLDVGCGSGLFLNVFLNNFKYKWQLYGLDINRKVTSKAQKMLKNMATIYTASLNTKKIKANSLECVTCFDVLEHANNINTNIKWIHQILKKDGLLVIQVPNYKSVMQLLTSNHWDWWIPSDHVIHFSSFTLSNLLRKHHFLIKSISTWESQSDFVLNIQGSIRNNLPSIFYLNKIISKLIYPLLLLIFQITELLEKKFNIGGLILIYAIKK